jgi:hypothetical protein
MKPETVRPKNCPQKYSPTLGSSTSSSNQLKTESSDVAPATAPRLSQRRKSNSSSASNLSAKEDASSSSSATKVKLENSSTTPVTAKAVKNILLKSGSSLSNSLPKKGKPPKMKKIKTKRKSTEGGLSDNESDQEGEDSDKSVRDEDLLDGLVLEFTKLQPGSNQTQSNNRKENLCAICDYPTGLIECSGL